MGYIIAKGALLGSASVPWHYLIFGLEVYKSLEKSRNQSLVVSKCTSCFYLRWAPMIIAYYDVVVVVYYLCRKGMDGCQASTFSVTPSRE